MPTLKESSDHLQESSPEQERLGVNEAVEYVNKRDGVLGVYNVHC